MSLTQRIIEHLTDYLAGDISVRDLRIEAARATIAGDVSDARTRALVYGVQHRLAEFTNGDWSESELRDLLRPFVNRYYVEVQAVRRARSSRSRQQIPWTLVRTGPLAESA